MKVKILFIALLFALPLVQVTAQEQASVILQQASAQAKKEQKNVFVMFHASWCGWCKKMEKNMESDACKKLFGDNFVTVHLTVQESPKNKSLENPGADVVLEKYKGTKAGLPFWVILDAKGAVLADSFNAKGENLGCPSNTEEVAEFKAKLAKSSKLNDKQLAVIGETFIIKK
jgi:thioredoxin-related protein